MKTFEITASARAGLGKTGAKKVRKSGQVLCVIYGSGQPVHIAVDELPLKKLFQSPDTFMVNLTVDGSATQTVVRDAQFHPVFDNVLHVDFLRVAQDKPVDVELPVKLIGSAKGALEGGKLMLQTRKLRVKGLMASLPESIDIDVSDMGLGDTKHVADLPTVGFEFVGDPARAVVSVNVPRSAKEEIATTATAAAAAPVAAAAPAPEKEKEKGKEEKKEKKK